MGVLISCFSTAPKFVYATEIVWNLNPSESTLKVIVDVYIDGEYGLSFVPQAPGADITTYSGTLTTQLNSSTIQVTAANMVAANSGSWDPLPNFSPGTAPANYGHLIDFGSFGTALTVIRNASAAVDSTLLTLAGGPSSFTFDFDADDLNLDYTITSATRSTGQLNDLLGSFGGGGVASSFLLPETGSVEKSPGLWTLTIPVTASIDSLTVEDTPLGDLAVRYQLIGQIVATVIVPEPSTALLLVLGGLALFVVGARSSWIRPGSRALRTPGER